MADPSARSSRCRRSSLADYFNTRVGRQARGGHRVELAVPDGPSTGGGKQALQHIRLVPDAGARRHHCRIRQPSEKTAELRTWEHLAQLHAQRFKGKTIPLDRVEYNELLKRMQAFFGEQR